MANRRPIIWQQLSDPVAEAAGEEVHQQAADEALAEMGASADTAPAVVDRSGPIAPDDNEDPLRRRIWHGQGRPGWLKSILRRLFAKRELTPAEAADLREAQRRDAMRKLLHDEAILLRNRIVKRLTEIGFAYKRVEGGHLRVISTVRFSEVISTPDAHFLRFAPSMPDGVKISDIIDKKNNTIMDELSVACGVRIRGRYTPENGAWLMAERGKGVMGIPEHVKLVEMLEYFPESAGSMTIPLGMTYNHKPIFRDIAAMPHLVVAGTTGGGKSNEINVIMIVLLSRNKPTELKVLMVDLKGGMEFSHYRGVPHLLSITSHVGDEKFFTDGIITEPAAVPVALAWVVQESKRRMELISGAGYSDIVDYNAKHYKNRIPRLLVVFDELASLPLLDAKAGKRAEALMTVLGNQGRAVGIHIMVCSQFPDRKIISTAIKAVLPAKLAFSCSTPAASMVILGTWDALRLSPKGRFVYQSGDEQLEIQGPYFPKEHRNRMLDEIRAGRSGLVMEPVAHDVTPQEIMEWAMANANGYLSRDRLYKQFENRGLPRAELNRWLASWEGQSYRVGDAWYKVEKPANPNQSRLLKPIDAPVDAPIENSVSN